MPNSRRLTLLLLSLSLFWASNSSATNDFLCKLQISSTSHELFLLRGIRGIQPDQLFSARMLRIAEFAYAKIQRDLQKNRPLNVRSWLRLIALRRSEIRRSIHRDQENYALFAQRKGHEDSDTYTAFEKQRIYDFWTSRSLKFREKNGDIKTAFTEVGTEVAILKIEQRRLSDGYRRYVWQHPDLKDIEAVLDQVQWLVERLLKSPPLGEKEIYQKVAEIHWWLSHAQAFKRGNASIADVFTKSLLLVLGQPLYKWSPGIAPDIEAFLSSRTEYIENYIHFFESP